MDKFTLYLREAYQELLYKVSWPTWKELQSSAVIVLIASILIAVAVVAIDQFSQVVLKQLYSLLW
jgi:preprotein translocase subunit SecE